MTLNRISKDINALTPRCLRLLALLCPENVIHFADCLSIALHCWFVLCIDRLLLDTAGDCPDSDKIWESEGASSTLLLPLLYNDLQIVEGKFPKFAALRWACNIKAFPGATFSRSDKHDLVVIVARQQPDNLDLYCLCVSLPHVFAGLSRYPIAFWTSVVEVR